MLPLFFFNNRIGSGMSYFACYKTSARGTRSLSFPQSNQHLFKDDGHRGDGTEICLSCAAMDADEPAKLQRNI